MPDVWRTGLGLAYAIAAWLAWRVFRHRRLMVDWAARGYELLYPGRSGMVRYQGYAREWGHR